MAKYANWNIIWYVHNIADTADYKVYYNKTKGNGYVMHSRPCKKKPSLCKSLERLMIHDNKESSFNIQQDTRTITS